ncbi:MAG: SAM-dependent methyltransferase, partial [Candidatus Methanoperedens sp.]|nr:SAM-dependent methyltransferase [Candidatus Methanoperedens sp.]
MVEKSPSLQKKQKKRLGNENVQWFDSINDLKGMEGCIFSNELPDAFPVHAVVMEKELMEVFVGYENNFIEVLKPASTQLEDYFKELDIRLPSGYRTEVNLDMIKWIREISSALKKGFVIT